PMLIDQAVAHEQRFPLGVRYRVGDISKNGGLGRGRYNIVLSCQTLTTIPKLNETVAESARVLDKGGRLIIAINHPCFVRPGSAGYFVPQSVWCRFFPGQI